MTACLELRVRAARLVQKKVRQARLARGANQQVGRRVGLSVEAAREERVGDVAAIGGGGACRLKVERGLKM